LIWFVGELILFAGAGAVLAGTLALSRGESIANGWALVIASGLVAVAAILVSRKMMKLSEPFPTPARA
jgi:hypothetical protein